MIAGVQVSETMSVSNGHLPNSYDEGEDKPMLVVKKPGDGPGITALLNRQLQGNITSLIGRDWTRREKAEKYITS
jgi:hypothetical protein